MTRSHESVSVLVLRRDHHPASRSAYDLLPGPRGPRQVECDGPKLNFYAHIGG